MKKILVPTDFSNHADNALKLASELAKAFGASIHLIHVISFSSFQLKILKGEVDVDQIEAESDSEIWHYVNSKFDEIFANPMFNEIELERRIEFGKAYQKIIEVANSEEYDLVVAGIHGFGDDSTEFAGGNIEKIVRISPIPVITVKEFSDSFSPKTILFSSTFFHENKTALSFVAKLSKGLGAKIHLLKVITPGSFENSAYSEKIIKELANSCGLDNYEFSVVNDYEVENGIYFFSKKIDADMICLATHQKTRWTRLFGKSIANEISSHANKPVLTIRLSEHNKKSGSIFPE